MLLIVSPPAKRARKEVLSEVCLLVQKAQESDINNSGAWIIIDNKMLIYPWLTKNMVYSRIIQSKVKTKAYILDVLTSPVTTTTTDIAL